MKYKLFKAKVALKEKTYSKSMKIATGDIHLELIDYDRSYDEYVKPALAYYAKEKSVLILKLSVNDIVDMGEYLRGILGGEKKKGSKRYAGLVILDEKIDATGYYIVKLTNVKVSLKIPSEEYEKHKFILIYADSVHPFGISHTFKILLSEKGIRDLREFLKRIMSINNDRLSQSDIHAMETLLTEVKQPKLSPLSEENYYVIYRSKSTFSATVFKPDHNRYIVYSNLGYIDCKTHSEKAYFYAAIFNYLAYKTITLKRPFIRDQYLRPVIAIVEAGLTWPILNQNNPELVEELVNLSRKLHDIASKVYRGKIYEQERIAFKELSKAAEFKELIKLIDEYMKDKEDQLHSALEWVSEEPN
ncbi:MAG: hypothetical protein B6U89_03765 [Desulfurococcales archaeon ex4484_58]|nr:MAG: hypothetical protein B6U89_03765 [Desulfurococcales archaeon ex4484_58]